MIIKPEDFSKLVLEVAQESGLIQALTDYSNSHKDSTCMNRTNFVKTPKKALRDDAEMAVIRTKKGKLHKPTRGKDNWGNLEMYTTPETCKQRHADSVNFSTQRPAWEII